MAKYIAESIVSPKEKERYMSMIGQGEKKILHYTFGPIPTQKLI